MACVLPVVLIYMVMLINKKSLMKDWTNSPLYNAVAWVAVVIMIGLTLALASITVKQMTHSARALRSATGFKAAGPGAARQFQRSFAQSARS